METLNHYAERLNHLPIDLRAEVVLADLLEDGISLDDLILNPVGAFERALGRDIRDTAWVESQRVSQRWLQINLNRSGLYDLLPEGVFHQPTTNETLTVKEAILQEMAVQHQREKAARQFFLPIEQEFIRERVRIEQESRSFLLDTQPDDLMGDFWELPSFLTPLQTKRLLYLLPLMYRFAGDLPAMTACFEQLIDERISLHYDAPGQTFVETDSDRLGQWQLGETSVFGGWVQNEEPVLRLTVHIERSERLTNYLPGQNGRRLIDWLSGYLVPLDVDLVIDLDTSAFGEAFAFTDESTNSLLSFSTYVHDF